MPRHIRKSRPRRIARRRVRKARARAVRGRVAIPRGVNRPSIHYFKRTIANILTIGTPSAGFLLNSDSTAMGKTFDFRLDDLNDYSDFVNLFSYYKINAVAVKIYPCNTTTAADPTSMFNNQHLIRWDNNWQGGTTGNSDPQVYMDSQTSKKRPLMNSRGSPTNFYMKVRQSSMVYQAGLTSTAYALVKPRWCHVSESDVAHYGLNMCIHRVDGSAFSALANQTKARIEYTYYISCKKVQ